MQKRKELLISIFVLFSAAAIPLCIRWGLNSFRESRVERIINSAEELVAQVPYFQERIQDNMELINDVRCILESKPSFSSIRLGDDSVLYVWSDDGEQESIEKTKLFGPEEKEIICSVFSEQVPFCGYIDNTFSIKSLLGETVFLNLQYIPNREIAQSYSTSFYYMEEVFEDWYLYVLIDRMSPSSWKTEADKGTVSVW